MTFLHTCGIRDRADNERSYFDAAQNILRPIEEGDPVDDDDDVFEEVVIGMRWTEEEVMGV